MAASKKHAQHVSPLAKAEFLKEIYLKNVRHEHGGNTLDLLGSSPEKPVLTERTLSRLEATRRSQAAEVSRQARALLDAQIAMQNRTRSIEPSGAAAGCASQSRSRWRMSATKAPGMTTSPRPSTENG